MADEHDQQPADEEIAEGNYPDVEALDQQLDDQVKAGAVNPTGYNPPASSPNPYLSEEDQGMELTPKTFGPPQYGSPDPASAVGKLTTLEDGHPLDNLPEGHTARISDDYGQDAVESQEVDATESAKELAKEKNVDLSQVQGSGAEGRITKGDVEDYIASQDND